ncbi:S41 family peptidase [Shewanella sp. NIFS-20-20]|uniref:S41 family peptidase n=1 Tax=Shewanella sp. NIFS-20-20 TaxID=2853806 RepID=UPI001C458EBB|nr:S41 family peptidase [Shewanella sp. NIFS-20-20]MBV7315544.1 S41 family peptidase [Shewanella sp. NIFS-20-20]
MAGYLRQWRPGHLAIMSLLNATHDNAAVTQEPTIQRDPYSPQFTSLSKLTLLMTLPSFSWQYQAPIEALLNNNRASFDSHPDWIIDVRNNGGGSDSSYQQRLAWVLHNQTIRQNAEFLVTKDNIKAQMDICSTQEDNLACEQFIAPVVRAMQQGKSGDYVLPQGQPALQYDQSDADNIAPQQVAVLIDSYCGS